MWKNTYDKKRFLLVFLTGISIICFTFGLFIHEIVEIASSFIGRFLTSGDLGRNEIWTYCWNLFVKNPVFGYGFVSNGPIPSLENANRVIMAHNTLLQYLCSLGIVGTLLMSFFIFKKYQLMFKNYNKNNMFLIVIVIVIALSGITDQGASMDIFVYLITVLILATIELNPKKKVAVADKCCLCYGSTRALQMVRDSAKKGKKSVLFKELLHNKRVVKELNDLNISKVENIEDFKKGDYVILRAHGEAKSTYDALNKKGIEFLDCTCPNVMAIHKLVQRKEQEGYKIIIVGKNGKTSGKMHAEVAGIAGQCTPLLIEDFEDAQEMKLNFDKYYLVVQTTFSKKKAKNIIENLKKRCLKENKEFDYKDTTCRAGADINAASIELAKNVDFMFVLGGKNSSNTKELFDNVKKYCTTYFVENIDEVKKILSDIEIKENTRFGLTGGASTMKEELFEIKDYIENFISSK